MCAVLALVMFAPSLGAQSPIRRFDVRASIDLFDRVWRAVEDRYYDPKLNGLDWSATRAEFRPLAEAASDESELYGVLRRMLGMLGDAHTRIFSPADGYDRLRPAGVTVGLTARRVEGDAAIVWVEPGSEAARQGVRPGWILRAIDGVAVEDALARVRNDLGYSSTPQALETLGFERLFWGQSGTEVEIAVEDVNGTVREIVLRRRFVDFPRRVVSRRLPNEIGYIELTGFAPDIEREFEFALESMRDTRGLVLDLRQNGGGFVSSVVKVASHFLGRDVALGEFITRQGRRSRRRTERVRANYRAPIVVLTSARSASGAEMLAAALAEYGRAKVIGVQPSTCGCLLGVSRTIDLPDGGKLNISDTDYRTARGNRIEGVGVRADEVVDLRLADLRAQRDRALEIAVEKLRRDSQPRADLPLSTPRLNR
ncbi:MAG: hypothetical protein KF868_17915 [Acidobacteria bacterium]|nr:hypothetical protein [Acidobacteriota bacterium]MCW5969142.1 hypothetical protein [Blastocatellales bacterium]